MIRSRLESVGPGKLHQFRKRFYPRSLYIMRLSEQHTAQKTVRELSPPPAGPGAGVAMDWDRLCDICNTQARTYGCESGVCKNVVAWH